MNLKKRLKKRLKARGFFLIILGVFIIIIQPFSMTGAVIDLSTTVSRVWFFIGLGLIGIGIMFVLTQTKAKTLEVRIEPEKDLDYFKKRTQNLLDSKYKGQDAWVSRWELDGIIDYIKNARDRSGHSIYAHSSFEHDTDTPTIHLAGQGPKNIPHMNMQVGKGRDKIKRHLFITNDPQDERLKYIGLNLQTGKKEKSNYESNHPFSEKEQYKRGTEVS